MIKSLDATSTFFRCETPEELDWVISEAGAELIEPLSLPPSRYEDEEDVLLPLLRLHGVPDPDNPTVLLDGTTKYVSCDVLACCYTSWNGDAYWYPVLGLPFPMTRTTDVNWDRAPMRFPLMLSTHPSRVFTLMDRERYWERGGEYL